MNYLISGGGTGGHIFPAVSIANALKQLDPEAKILFVGAKGRMEETRVPEAGYDIVCLPVRGFNRAQPWKNVSVVIDMLRSMWQVRGIIRRFRPDAGVGVGGYASGAAMKVAAKMGVPILLQEQNGFAGVTNKMLRQDAQVICVAYEGMERFFPKEKIVLTGNPVRQNLLEGDAARGKAFFEQQTGVQLRAERPTLLVIGGSLGARTVNEAMIAGLPALIEAGVNVIWQTGKYYEEECQKAFAAAEGDKSHIVCTAFLSNMPDCYAMADLVISRAGASSISEICLLGKASVLVPSPNVAEDHQTHNAMALVGKDAAVLVRDAEAGSQLIETALGLLGDEAARTRLATNVARLAQRDSANRIAKLVIEMAQKH